MLLVEFLKDGKPLFELIELRAAITEVDDDFTAGIAAVEFVFEPVPALGTSDPLARILPSRRSHCPLGGLADQILHYVPFDVDSVASAY